jgi:hypothetical protein
VKVWAMDSGFALWDRYALGNPVMLCALSSWRGEASIDNLKRRVCPKANVAGPLADL